MFIFRTSVVTLSDKKVLPKIDIIGIIMTRRID